MRVCNFVMAKEAVRFSELDYGDVFTIGKSIPKNGDDIYLKVEPDDSGRARAIRLVDGEERNFNDIEEFNCRRACETILISSEVFDSNGAGVPGVEVEG